MSYWWSIAPLVVWTRYVTVVNQNRGGRWKIPDLISLASSAVNIWKKNLHVKINLKNEKHYKKSMTKCEFSNISNTKDHYFTTFSKSKKRVENTTHSEVFSMNFEEFGNVVKRCLSCMIDMSSQSKWKRRRKRRVCIANTELIAWGRVKLRINITCVFRSCRNRKRMSWIKFYCCTKIPRHWQPGLLTNFENISLKLVLMCKTKLKGLKRLHITQNLILRWRYAYILAIYHLCSSERHHFRRCSRWRCSDWNYKPGREHSKMHCNLQDKVDLKLLLKE